MNFYEFHEFPRGILDHLEIESNEMSIGLRLLSICLAERLIIRDRWADSETELTCKLFEPYLHRLAQLCR